jgi:hypothetical protein
VLDLSKIEAGGVEWRDETFRGSLVADAVVAMFQGMAEEKGIKLTVAHRPSGPTEGFLRGDRDRLMQVLVNLVNNAIKFTPEGGQIRVSSARSTPDEAARWLPETARPGQGAVLFAVEDTGVGIAPEHQALVFDRFRQVVDPSTGKPHGTGLGLAICREIVSRHGGRVGLRSALGQGSRFPSRCRKRRQNRARRRPRDERSRDEPRELPVEVRRARPRRGSAPRYAAGRGAVAHLAGGGGPEDRGQPISATLVSAPRVASERLAETAGLVSRLVEDRVVRRDLVAQMARLWKEQNFLTTVATALTAQSTPEETAQRLLPRITKLLAVQRASIVLARADRKLVVAAANGGTSQPGMVLPEGGIAEKVF